MKFQSEGWQTPSKLSMFGDSEWTTPSPLGAVVEDLNLPRSYHCAHSYEMVKSQINNSRTWCWNRKRHRRTKLKDLNRRSISWWKTAAWQLQGKMTGLDSIQTAALMLSRLDMSIYYAVYCFFIKPWSYIIFLLERAR